MAALTSGIALGAAMVAGGFTQPVVVSSQMRLEDWTLVQALTTAAASSA